MAITAFADEPAKANVENQLFTRFFRISTSFCCPETEETEKELFPLILDGLEDNEKTRTNNARKFLEERGVKFPPGSAAVYYQHAAILGITNTAENIRKTADIFRDQEAEFQVRMILIEIRVVEYQPEVEEHLNTTGTFQTLEKKYDGAIKTLCISSLITKSGNRALAQFDGAHTKSKASLKQSKDESWPPPAGMERSIFEVEPVIGRDGKTVDMQMSFKYAARSGVRVELLTNVTVEDGQIFKAKTFTVGEEKNAVPSLKHCAVLVSCQIVDGRGYTTKQLREEFRKK